METARHTNLTLRTLSIYYMFSFWFGLVHPLYEGTLFHQSLLFLDIQFRAWFQRQTSTGDETLRGADS